MQTIPLAATPSQEVTVTLANQVCRVKVSQKSTGLFLDLYVSDALIVAGVICHNLNKIVRETYRGFVGDLTFYDTQGADDPYYTGLGARFLLLYLEASDL